MHSRLCAGREDMAIYMKIVQMIIYENIASQKPVASGWEEGSLFYYSPSS